MSKPNFNQNPVKEEIIALVGMAGVVVAFAVFIMLVVYIVTL